jgi:hypothetical protein
MARDFDGNAQKIRQASTTVVARALNINLSRCTPVERQCLDDWSLLLALIPSLTRWTRDEKIQLAKIIRAKSGPDEMFYLHQTQRHQHLRRELLRIGSPEPNLALTQRHTSF